ncbi:hypothetical protein [Streptacidiphilus sp. EB129]|jgi:hypothetical protein|uniref:hypothetical protein n=1 Tax=Streptacidiphilus sp. EB129 TaxID=3156262 RepID=UPI0035164780
MVQKSDSGTPSEGPRDPFAPPPKDAPDRPWQPRGRATEPPHGRRQPEDGDQGSEDRPEGGRPAGPPVVPPPHPWGPGYQGQQPPRFPSPPQGPRFDPSDPVQRRARYALLSGMWGIFFLILGVPYVTLLLASLALYWSISSLRGKAKTPPPPTTGAPSGYTPGYPTYPTRPQVPAALGGLVAAVVGLALVATTFGVQLYYKSYYDCQANALTKAAYSNCATSVTPQPPKWLVQLGG